MAKKILLIEDEAAIAENVVYALETEGFNVTWNSLGQQGLDFVRNQPIDLLILDVGLPDISGFELCKQIRTLSDVPIIFLTARSEEIDRVVGLEIGGDDYVTKPFSPRELTARVKVILKRIRNINVEPNIDRPDFIIDSEKNAITYCETPLELTRYEYLILKTLLHRPERVYSRAQLMDLVWDEPESSFDRAVDTHIKSLRAKLKRISSSDPIKTQRGFGYSIKATKHEI